MLNVTYSGPTTQSEQQLRDEFWPHNLSGSASTYVHWREQCTKDDRHCPLEATGTCYSSDSGVKPEGAMLRDSNVTHLASGLADALGLSLL